MRWLTIALLVLTLGAVWAKDYVDITIGGKFIMRLRTGVGDLTREERAQILEERLVKLLGERLTADQITLKEVRKDQQYEIHIRGQLFVTVTPADAEAAKMSVRQLAEHWLKQLRANLPPLSARPPA